MEATQRIRHDDLPEDAQRVIDAVHHGEAAIIERNGQPEVAIIDIVDYRLLRAAMRYYSDPPVISAPEAGLSREAVGRVAEGQDRYDLVLAYYLAETISLSRAAELLGLSSIDLRFRFHHLGLPLRIGPATVEEALEDLRVAESFGRDPR